MFRFFISLIILSCTIFTASAQWTGIFNPLIMNAVPFAFATFDPATNTNAGVLSNGNKTYAANSGSGNVVRSTKFTALSKIHVEYTFSVVVSGGWQGAGVIQQSQSTVTPITFPSVPAGMWAFRDDALIYNNGTSSSYGSSLGSGAILIIEFDANAGKLWFGVCTAGTPTFFGSGNPSAGTNPSFSGLTGSIGFFSHMWGTAGGSQTGTINSGETAFSCTPSAGFGVL